jgi:hypothetical protein
VGVPIKTRVTQSMVLRICENQEWLANALKSNSLASPMDKMPSPLEDTTMRE